jgi:RNA polymerase sigma-70 factor (ECF subfamily)
MSSSGSAGGLVKQPAHAGPVVAAAGVSIARYLIVTRHGKGEARAKRLPGDQSVRRAVTDFAEFFGTRRDVALRVVFAALSDRATAEDAVAEAFARAYQRWATVREHPNPTAWVIRTALNVSRSWWRRRRREFLTADATEPCGPSDNAHVPAFDDVLSLAVAALSRRQREVVALRIIADMTAEEAGDLLGISAATVNVHLHRGLDALRKALSTTPSGHPVDSEHREMSADMLTDNELTHMIVGHYADVEMRVPLESIERRRNSRVRHRRVGLATAAVAALVLIGGTAAVASHRPHVSAAQMTQDCDRQFAVMSGDRSDHSQLPAELSPPLIDMRHGNAALRVYGDLTTTTAKRFVFDCERSGSGHVSAHLSVAHAVNASIFDAEFTDYRDYFPDGSGALVGVITSGITSVNVTSVAGQKVDVQTSGQVFAAWSPSGDLNDAKVSVSSVDANEWTKVTLGMPTLPNTFDAKAFGSMCLSVMTHAVTYTNQHPTGPRYVGPTEPALKLAHDGQVFWLYRGNIGYVCGFTDVPDGLRFSVDPLGWNPQTATATEYGVSGWVGTGVGFAIGLVPPDVTQVQIKGRNGATADAQVHDGVFGVWASEKAFDMPPTVIATSPTAIYTIVLGEMTTKTVDVLSALSDGDSGLLDRRGG